MLKRLLVVIVVIALVAVAVRLVFFKGPADDGVLRLSGNIEATDVRLSFKIPGRLASRQVAEGESVAEGQLVATLDPTDQQLSVAQAAASVVYAESVLAELEAGSRPEQLSQAAAQVAQARAALEQLEHGSRTQEIASAEAAVEQALAAAAAAQVQLDLAQADYERSQELYAAGVVPAQRNDQARTAWEGAQRAWDGASAAVKSTREQLSLAHEGPRVEQVDQARAALQQVQAGYALLAAGPRAETIAQAEAQLELASQKLRQANQQLEYTKLKAEAGGIVLSKAAEPGEYLNPGAPVVTIGYLDQVWLRGYINETDLGRVRAGQQVEVTTDSYPGVPYSGRISFISSNAEFTPKAVQTTSERVKLMYMVKIELDNPEHELKPGMPADAVITLAE
jgi:HlyD family secretion protein